MSTRRLPRRAAWSSRATWVLLGVVAAVAGLALALPSWRSPAVGAASIASVALVVLGVLLHRPPRSTAWWLLALTLALWGTAGLQVQAAGRLSGVGAALVWGGQAVAASIVVHVARRRPGQAPSPGGRLDLVVIAAVLALVGAQLVAVAVTTDGELSGVAVASVDVALLGVLLRFLVSGRALPVSSWLLLSAAALTILYDLSNALAGRRLALPGEPAQAVGAACVLVFGLAALHPSMAEAFTAQTFARRRRPSAALLGLLPLVFVPAALWWVAQVTRAPGLPGWTVPVAGAVIAGLCLLRAAAALRSSEHLAEHDPLTDLLNRRGLSREFAEGATGAGRSLLLLDVDEFKQVNDTYGHDVGDALLLQVRDRLLAATGAAGVVVRLGGDEFVVLTATQHAEGIAQRLLRSLQEPCVVGGVVLRVGASVGLAETGDDPGALLPELLTHADVAMYNAKAAGGGTAVRFHPDMRVEVARRYTLSSEVRRLLGGQAPEVGRLEVHYQPLVELASGGVVGAEALVRWRHPEHGLLAPDAFLGAVNHNDLDAQLDSAVLQEVVDQVARWQDQGRRRLPVSVNLTRDSLDDPHLAERVLAVLARAGVPASALHLEITEHEPLPDDSSAAQSLADLCAAGVEVHLDDYGTGYTSLDYLRRFPVRVLKLDRSVVGAVSRGDDQIVAAVQAMATTLGLQVLAEGVETEEQREHLLALGVRYGQGYLFSRPLPADDYAEKVLGGVRPRQDVPAQRPVTLGVAAS